MQALIVLHIAFALAALALGSVVPVRRKRHRLPQNAGANLGVAHGGSRTAVALDLRDPPRGWPFVSPPALGLDADFPRLRHIPHPAWQGAGAQAVHDRHLSRACRGRRGRAHAGPGGALRLFLRVRVPAGAKLDAQRRSWKLEGMAEESFEVALVGIGHAIERVAVDDDARRI